MGKLDNHVSLYRLVHISTRGTSLESLARVDVGEFRGSPGWLSWPPAKILRDMADQMDREAEQQSAVLDGRFPAELAGRLSGLRSGQSGKRPGYLVQACQRAWHISAVFPSKWQQKRQQRSRKWRRRVERRRRRRTRHAEEKQASRKAHDIGVPEKGEGVPVRIGGSPQMLGSEDGSSCSSPMLRVRLGSGPTGKDHLALNSAEQ